MRRRARSSWTTRTGSPAAAGPALVRAGVDGLGQDPPDPASGDRRQELGQSLHSGPQEYRDRGGQTRSSPRTAGRSARSTRTCPAVTMSGPSCSTLPGTSSSTRCCVANMITWSPAAEPTRGTTWWRRRPGMTTMSCPGRLVHRSTPCHRRTRDGPRTDRLMRSRMRPPMRRRPIRPDRPRPVRLGSAARSY